MGGIVSRALFIVALLLTLVTPSSTHAADAVDPPAPAAPPVAAPPPAEPASAEPPPIVVEPSPVGEVPRAPAPAPPQPTAPTAVAATPAVAAAQPTPRLKRERQGLAVLLGMGMAYSAIGGHLRYDIPVRRSLTLSPFVGAGMYGALPGPLGVGTALGYRHRVVADLAVAPLAHSSLVLHGTVVTERMFYGPTAGVGYEHMSDGGWIQRFTLEYGYPVGGGAVPPPARHLMFLSLGFGWRIW